MGLWSVAGKQQIVYCATRGRREPFFEAKVRTTQRWRMTALCVCVCCVCCVFCVLCACVCLCVCLFVCLSVCLFVCFILTAKFVPRE